MAYTIDQEAARRLRDADARAGGSRAAYLGAVEGFDPASYMQTAAGSVLHDLLRQFGQQRAGHEASMNARGLFNSRVGQAGMERNFADASGRAIAGLALDQARLEQQRQGMLGSLYNMDRGDVSQYFDAQTGLAMSREQQRTADKASKRAMWGNIAGHGLTAVGTFLGGPAGAIVAKGAGKLLGKIFSDETLKEDVRDTAPVLPRVRQLKGKSWRWNEEGRRLTGDHGNRRRRGVMAQDVARTFPELVARDADSGRMQVDYGGLAATLVDAIGELDAKIEARSR